MTDAERDKEARRIYALVQHAIGLVKSGRFPRMFGAAPMTPADIYDIEAMDTLRLVLLGHERHEAKHKGA